MGKKRQITSKSAKPRKSAPKRLNFKLHFNHPSDLEKAKGTFVFESSPRNGKNYQPKCTTKSPKKSTNKKIVAKVKVEQHDDDDGEIQLITEIETVSVNSVPKPKYPNLNDLFQKLQQPDYSLPSISSNESSPSSSYDRIPKNKKKSEKNYDHLELEHFRNQSIRFETFVNLPKFREIFDRPNTLEFYCKICRITKKLIKPDKNAFINHVDSRLHQMAEKVTQFEDGITVHEAVTRKTILDEFYWVEISEDSRYCCLLCDYQFDAESVYYGKVKRHEGTRNHLIREKEAFGSVFSRPLDEQGKIVPDRSKPESAKQKLQVMNQLISELKIWHKNVFGLKEVEIKDADGSVLAKELKLACIMCDVVFDPNSYLQSLKYNALEHLKCDRHLHSIKRKRGANGKQQVAKQQNNKDNNQVQVSKPLQVRFYKKKIQKLAQEMKNRTENL